MDINKPICTGTLFRYGVEIFQCGAANTQKKMTYQSKSAGDKPCLNYQSVNLMGCGVVEQSK
jgi:hypothetical protein